MLSTCPGFEELETARNAKQIGKALEADITLYTDVPEEDIFGKLDVDLAHFFIVSHADIKPLANYHGPLTDIRGLGNVGIEMTPARGMKCGRCWQYREEVSEEGGLCARCDEVVSSMVLPDAPTV